LKLKGFFVSGPTLSHLYLPRISHVRAVL